MDTKGLLLGVMPPAMAIWAEVMSPISKSVIKAQTSATVARQLVRQRGVTDSEYEGDVDNIAEVISHVSTVVAVIAELIPTWIGVTAGLASVIIEVLEQNVAYFLITLWTMFWAMIGIKWFSTVDYYGMTYVARSPFGIGFTGEKVLRIGIIGTNAFVVLLVLGTWMYSSTAIAIIP